MFYLAPLALIALLAWLERGSCRAAARVLVVAAGVAARPAVLHPVHALHTRRARLRHLRAAAVVVGAGHLIHLSQVRWAALGVSLARRRALRLLPRRYALVLPRARRRVLRRHGLRGRDGRTGSTRRRSARSGRHAQAHRDWIDRLVGRNAASRRSGPDDAVAVSRLRERVLQPQRPHGLRRRRRRAARPLPET